MLEASAIGLANITLGQAQLGVRNCGAVHEGSPDQYRSPDQGRRVRLQGVSPPRFPRPSNPDAFVGQRPAKPAVDTTIVAEEAGKSSDQRPNQRPRSDRLVQRFGQVRTPSSVYAGQKPTIPVSNGTMPIQPHGVCGPTNTSAIKNSPTITRNRRSRLPSLRGMASNPFR